MIFTILSLESVDVVGLMHDIAHMVEPRIRKRNFPDFRDHGMLFVPARKPGAQRRRG